MPEPSPGPQGHTRGSAPAVGDVDLPGARVPGEDIMSLERFDNAIREIRSEIQRLSPHPERVKVVAVTKGQPTGVAAMAIANLAEDRPYTHADDERVMTTGPVESERGILVGLGENYAVELVEKAGQVDAILDQAVVGGVFGGPKPRVPWHFLGRIQRNKIAKIAGSVSLWQSVSRAEEGETIARCTPGAAVMVQVMTDPSPERGGCPPRQVGSLVENLRLLGLSVEGVMAVAPHGDLRVARTCFNSVVEIQTDLGLSEVSIGMSHDFKVALEAGSTMLRIGSLLFGERIQPYC